MAESSHEAVPAEDGGFAHHGGRLSVARRIYATAPQPWLDLSTGINPRSYPAPRASTAMRARLPEVDELARLERVAAEAFGVADPACVVAVGGTEAGLRVLPLALRLKRAAVAEPTYGSHADAWVRAGAEVSRLSLAEVLAHSAGECAVTLVNPNNPDGARTQHSCLLEVHDRIAACEGALIVDEAFVDVTPEISVSAFAGTSRAPRLVVLRSFGKFYGLAGLRLGFVICAPALARAFRGLMGDWPVSVDALVAGLAAYADGEWALQMRQSLARDAARMDRLLSAAGFEVVGGTSLYRLARAADARRRFEALAAAGILVRPFSFDETLLRFGLPGVQRNWKRLTAALEGLR